VSALAAILGRLATEGLTLELREGKIAVPPKDRLTADLREAILCHREEVLELLRLHGNGLLALFKEAPVWPPPRGRSGPLAASWWQSVGDPVQLSDGREGSLRLIAYNTSTGRVRLRVDFRNGWKLVDPEDATPLAEADRRTA
jgi:hypothetical protein